MAEPSRRCAAPAPPATPLTKWAEGPLPRPLRMPRQHGRTSTRRRPTAGFRAFTAPHAAACCTLRGCCRQVPSWIRDGRGGKKMTPRRPRPPPSPRPPRVLCGCAPVGDGPSPWVTPQGEGTRFGPIPFHLGGRGMGASQGTSMSRDIGGFDYSCSRQLGDFCPFPLLVYRRCKRSSICL